MTRGFCVAMFFAGLISGGCASVKYAPVADTSKWRLIWSDEFDQEGAPDPSKWGYEEGFVRNGELQYYTKGRGENARIENGMLVIEARKEEWANAAYQAGSADWDKSRPTAAYTSASLQSKGKAEWTYGRIDIRLKVPEGRGTWPAAWLLGANIDKAGWPRCGEIDMMEYVGFEPDKLFTTVHTQKYNWAAKTPRGESVLIPGAGKDFHICTLEWSRDQLEFFVDGKSAMIFRNDHSGEGGWPFDKPQFLLLNLAIGGGWGGQKGVDDSIFPLRYLVDYVRVYEAIRK